MRRQASRRRRPAPGAVVAVLLLSSPAQRVQGLQLGRVIKFPHRLRAALAAGLCLQAQCLHPVYGVAWAAPAEQSLSTQDLGTLSAAYEAYNKGEYAAAEPLLSQSLRAWLAAGAPSDELAALLKLRGNCRTRLAQLRAALDDYDEAVRYLERGGGEPDPAEIPDTFRARARAEEALGLLERAEQDYTRALQLFDELDLGGGDEPNPFLLAERGRVRLRAGASEGAAGDFLGAERTFAAIGDRPRAAIARADLALAQFGAGRTTEALLQWAQLTLTVRDAVSRDIPLLQELSRREAEAHIALAAAYWEREPARAEAEWAEGCERLDATLTDAFTRRDQGSATPPAAGAGGVGGGGAAAASIEPGDVALCGKFRDLEWVRRERLWPRNLTEKLGAFLGTTRRGGGARAAVP